MDVTIFQRPKQLMNPFDADMASFIHNQMRKHGVKPALGYTVEGFSEKDDGVDVLLKDAAPFHADMVVLAIGVTPDTHFAKEVGLKATQLKDLDLAYAPPYFSAKDPVNISGFMVDNFAKGILKQWHLKDIRMLPKDGSVMLTFMHPAMLPAFSYSESSLCPGKALPCPRFENSGAFS